MIYGIGTDLVRIERFNHWNDAMIERFFETQEIAYCLEKTDSRSASLAARFAAKEAFGKAIGTGLAGIKLKSIAIHRDGRGKPYFFLAETIRKLIDPQNELLFHVSLSHDREYAIATVVIEKRGIHGR